MKKISKRTIVFILIYAISTIMYISFGDSLLILENKYLSIGIFYLMIITMIFFAQVCKESLLSDPVSPTQEEKKYDLFSALFEMERMGNEIRCIFYSSLTFPVHKENYELLVKQLMIEYFKNKPVIVRYEDVRYENFMQIKEEIKDGKVEVLDILEKPTDRSRDVYILLKNIQEAYYVAGLVSGRGMISRENIRRNFEMDVYMDLDTNVMDDGEIVKRTKEIGNPKFKVEHRMYNDEKLIFLVDEKYADELKDYIRQIVRENGFKGEIIMK